MVRWASLIRPSSFFTAEGRVERRSLGFRTVGTGHGAVAGLWTVLCSVWGDERTVSYLVVIGWDGYSVYPRAVCWVIYGAPRYLIWCTSDLANPGQAGEAHVSVQSLIHQCTRTKHHGADMDSG